MRLTFFIGVSNSQESLANESCATVALLSADHVDAGAGDDCLGFTACCRRMAENGSRSALDASRCRSICGVSGDLAETTDGSANRRSEALLCEWRARSEREALISEV